MKRCQLLLLTVFLAVGLGLQSAPASGQDREPPGPAGSQPEPQSAPDRVPVELDHPISLESASRIANAVGWKTIEGFQYEAPGMYGEFFPHSPSQVDQFEQALITDYGNAPDVTAILVRPDDRRALAPKIVATARERSVGRSPGFTAGKTQAEAVEMVTRLDQEAELDEGRGPGIFAAPPYEPWAPPHTEVSSGTVNGVRKATTWWQWPGSSSYSPETLPDDWGLEAEINLFNEDISGTRPLCSPNPDGTFWMDEVTGWTVSTPFQSLLPEAFGAYLDDALYSDDCNRFSLAIGITGVASAPQWGSFNTRGFITTVYGTPGVSQADVFQGNYQAVSNDCDDLGLDPSSNCMGLNTMRDLPNSWGKTQLFVNKSRGWTIPGCYLHVADAEGYPIKYPADDCYF